METLEDRRVLAAGDLDFTFDGDGIVTTAIGSSHDEATSVVIDMNGKAVVAGYSFDGSTYNFALARYNADGSLDSSFDGDGKVTTNFGFLRQAYAYDVVVDGSGRIVVAGEVYNGSDFDFGLARYLPDGSLDSTFDSDGLVTTDINSSPNGANGLAIDSNGKIVIAGYTYSNGHTEFAVARYDQNGTLDTSFDLDGVAIAPFGTNASGAFGVVMDGNGKIVAAGTTCPSFCAFAVARFNDDGSLDPSLTAGVDLGTFAFTVGSDARGLDVALDSSGKILIAGEGNGGATADFAIARLNDSDGSLDSTFGTNGIATVSFSAGIDRGQSLVVTPAGKIIVAGFASNGFNDDFALARFNNNGALDSTFGAAGKVTTPIGTGTDRVYGVAIDGDYNIVVAGVSNNGSNNDFAVARYQEVSTLSAALDGLGNLTITDADETGKNNKFAVTISSGAYVLSDVNEQFVAAPTG